MATYNEVIYCKDCKYCKCYYRGNNNFSYQCKRLEKLNVQAFDYCSRAEYKENNK